MDNLLLELIEEKQKRDEFEKAVIDAVNKNYQIVDKKNAAAMKSATASNVYSTIGNALSMQPYFQFRVIVKDILIRNELIRPTIAKGYLFFRGLSAKAEDIIIIDRVLKKNNTINCRTYRRKNAANPLKE